MRKEYSGELRSNFHEILKRDFPQFTPCKSTNIDPGCRLYCYKVNADLVLFLYLAISYKDDRYTIFLAWSENGEFPVDPDFGPAHLQPKSGAKRISLEAMWNAKFRGGWVIEPAGDYIAQVINENDFSPLDIEKYKPNILITLQDVMQKITEYAMPYFEQIALERGYIINLRAD